MHDLLAELGIITQAGFRNSGPNLNSKAKSPHNSAKTSPVW